MGFSRTQGAPTVSSGLGPTIIHLLGTSDVETVHLSSIVLCLEIADKFCFKCQLGSIDSGCLVLGGEEVSGQVQAQQEN